MVIQPRKKTCPHCGGTGKNSLLSRCMPRYGLDPLKEGHEDWAPADECIHCDGKGYIEVMPRNIPHGPCLCCSGKDCQC
jgi:RecJ-like exonuclease